MGGGEVEECQAEEKEGTLVEEEWGGLVVEGCISLRSHC